MAITKKHISDSVLFILAKGYPANKFAVDERDIWASLENKINAQYKVEHFTQMKLGERIPDNLALAHYEDIAVTSNGNGTASCTFPVTPISLPKNMGVFDITTDGISFIPLREGQYALLKSQKLLNDLLGQVGYTPRKRTAVFTKDITLLGVSTVDMALVVIDVSDYGINDVLPVPADALDGIVNALVVQFSPTAPNDGIVNDYAATQIQPKQ